MCKNIIYYTEGKNTNHNCTIIIVNNLKEWKRKQNVLLKIFQGNIKIQKRYNDILGKLKF